MAYLPPPDHDLDTVDVATDLPVALIEGDVVTVMDGANQDYWPALARVDLADHAEAAVVMG